MQSWKPPSSRQLVSIRPLVTGIVRDVSPQMIPVEGFYDIENMIISDRGLVRRAGLIQFGTGDDEIPYRVQDVIGAWKTNGEKPIALVTDKTLFEFVPLVGETEIPWNYSAGTISVSGGYIIGSGADFLANDIMTGDVVRTVDGEAIIDSVLDADELTLFSGGLVDGAGQSYYIQRGFGPGNNPFVDAVVVGKSAGSLYGGLVLADGKRPLVRWDPDLGTLAYWTTKNRNMLPQDVSWSYSTGTITVSGTAITGSGTQFVTGDVHVGDIIVLGDGSEGVIETVTDAGSLVLEAATLDDGSGLSYTIYRASIPFVPESVVFFMDRIWVGSTYDTADGYKRQRIRWSDLADTSDFSTSTNYIDLPYVSGPIIRLVPMGDRLVVYFTDGIFVGMPTNYPTLPLRFEKVETGGIGLVGQKAVVPWIGGHFFVGTDGIYWLGYGAASIEQVGARIFDEALKNVSEPSRIIATADKRTKSIIFGFPGAGETVETLWYFHVIHKAWSTTNVMTECLAVLQYTKSATWDGLTGTWDTLGDSYPTWESFGSSDETEVLVMANSGSLWVENDAADTDYGTDPIPILLETGDLDFNAPDTLKIVTRLSLRITRQVTFDGAVDFLVRGSTNKGRTWKTLGNLHIPAGEDEGKVDFAITDSTIRFRITSASITAGYEIIEESIGVAGLGDELAIQD